MDRGKNIRETGKWEIREAITIHKNGDQQIYPNQREIIRLNTAYKNFQL